MQKRKDVKTAKAANACYWPSHKRFVDLVGYTVRGTSNPNFESWGVDDHIARTCELQLNDTDDFLWGRQETEGTKANMILQELDNRIYKENDLKAAETLYAIATSAARDVLSLYLRHRELFDQIAPRRRILPAFFSIHPETATVVRQMKADSHLGSRTSDAPLVDSKAYFLSDTAANIYARAIIHSIEINRNLESVEVQQKGWREFDRKERLRTVVLPFPKFINGIEAIPVPIRPDTVLQFWRKGKEMILEEMPDFHLRPEWKKYRDGRRYANGAKKGAVRHAIFKDILAALKTMAATNKRRATGLEFYGDDPP